MWGALVLSAVLAGPAYAQSNAATGAQSAVPTVTIINKAPDAGTPAPPELVVQPSAPERPSVPEAAPSASAPPAPPEAPAVAGSPPAETTPPAAASEAGATTPAGRAGEPPAASTDAESVAAAPAPPPPEPTLIVDIDLSRQTMTVSEEGETRHTWLISSARYGYRTPTGTYQPTWMAKMWYSRQYDYAPMPHAIFFHQGVAIHGTYALRALGRPASHGCVRLAPKNAAALFKLVNRHGKERTKIVVHGRPEHSDEYVASASDDLPRSRQRATAERQQLRRGSPSYRYLPPSYYGRGYAAYGPPPGYYAPRTRRHYAAPVRPPRGLYGGYSYGYGF